MSFMDLNIKLLSSEDAVLFSQKMLKWAFDASIALPVERRLIA